MKKFAILAALVLGVSSFAGAQMHKKPMRHPMPMSAHHVVHHMKHHRKHHMAHHVVHVVHHPMKPKHHH